MPDVCRYTFASYHAAFFRNLPELQLEMGHRDALFHLRHADAVEQVELLHEFLCRESALEQCTIAFNQLCGFFS